MKNELEKIAYMYGDVSIRKKKMRRKRQKILMKDLLTEYAKNSTLHGFRYMVDRGLHIMERIFWFLTVIVSITLCSFLIHNLILKWKSSPIIVTVNGRLSSVGSVPFPAVMICPQVKINPLIYNYTEKYKKLEENIDLQYEKDFTKYKNVHVMCDDITAKYKINYTEVFANISMVQDIIEVAPSQDDIFFSCKWQDEFVDCNRFFSKVITEEGVCYTSNSLSATDMFKEKILSYDYSFIESNTSQKKWSLDKGYNFENLNDFELNNGDFFYPRRGKSYGSEPDLALTLANDPERGDKHCNKIFSGYKIYLQHPADFPQTSKYFYAALPNQLTSVAISFHEFNTDEDLINYDSEIRQCSFLTGEWFKYFKIFTMTNCQIECLSQHMLYWCGCVAFYMPHIKGEKICHPIASFYCMRNVKDTVNEMERGSDMGLYIKGCRCLPACNNIEYDAEILKTDFRIEDIMVNSSFVGFSPSTTYSQVELFYKKPKFVTMQRREVYGVTDLLANIGGLLGLFLGFSFLSLIEIFYFLTVRVGFILRRDLKEEKSKD